MHSTPTDLKKDVPIMSLKAWYYYVIRFSLRLGANLSKGLEFGQKHGFDSGITLDHVYGNIAKGWGVIGRIVDQCYLSAASWSGFRNRSILLEQTIARQIVVAATDGKQVRVADLACGGGRYLLDAIIKTGSLDVNFVLRDCERVSVDKAKENFAQLGLYPRIENGDAFNKHDLASLGKQDILVASGLYEAIEDDNLVRYHFQQLGGVLQPGGKFIVTIQSTHPQLEFIARVFKNRKGRPWVMHLRSEALISLWLHEAGFEVQSVEMEETGSFGVMVAALRA